MTADDLGALTALLPAGRLITDPEKLGEYASDMTENPPANPAAAARPEDAGQVAAILIWATERRVPVTPCVGQTNVGGLTIPAEGGLVLDLRDLNRILAVDAEEMVAVIEPGVTFGQLREHLDAAHPELSFGYPLAPPHASVVANCLLDGLTNLSLRHGSMASWVNGLEVVLADGRTVRAGSAAASNSWFARGPLPDLAGLFLGWQGTTGIVTRMAVQLWPAVPHRRRFFLLFPDAETVFPFTRKLARTGLFDDLAALSWPMGRMIHEVYRDLARAPGEPEYLLYADLSALTADLMRAKEEVLLDALAGARRSGAEIAGPIDLPVLMQLNPALSRFAQFPMTLDFLLEHPGRGLTWVGTYGPTSRWLEGARRGAALLETHGFPPAVLTRAMLDGHYGVLRFPILFDRADPEEVRRVRDANAALLERVLELGFVMYKPPAWATAKLQAQMDPGYRDLLARVKALLDPAGILNPGKLGL